MRIGIDLGGTKIEIIALADDGHVLARRRVATPQGDYAATLAAVGALVDAVETELQRNGSVGVGIPGAISAISGLVKNANSTCLIGRPLRQDLQGILQREVRLENDANCFALSEAVDGAAAGASVVFGVILGTGVGGGIVLQGHVLHGANAIAGEWGHNPMLGETGELPQCYCGRNGCVETFLSGPGLRAEHLRIDGIDREPPDIVARAAAGDAVCEAALRRYEMRLARALAQVINILDPDAIVLGGGLSNVERLYEHIPRLWGPHVFSDHVATRLLRNRHGDSSGVRGAAWLWGGAATLDTPATPATSIAPGD